MNKIVINFFRWLRLKLKTLYRKVMAGQGTPHQISLGASIGMFVALTPTVGLQMIISIVLAKLFRANWVVAAPMAWITNPVTAPPYFYATYRIGAYIMGLNDDGSVFQKIIALAEKASQGHMLTFFEEMIKLTYDILLPLWLGSIIIAFIAGTITYPLTMRLVSSYRTGRKERRHKWLAALKHEYEKIRTKVHHHKEK